MDENWLHGLLPRGAESCGMKDDKSHDVLGHGLCRCPKIHISGVLKST